MCKSLLEELTAEIFTNSIRIEELLQVDDSIADKLVDRSIENRSVVSDNLFVRTNL